MTSILCACIFLMLYSCVVQSNANGIKTNIITDENRFKRERRQAPMPPMPPMPPTGGNLTSEMGGNRVNCVNGTFSCANGYCVQQTHVCDFRNDCGDRSDERGCTKRSETCWSWQEACTDAGSCRLNYFQCNNGKCIEFSRACNRKDECGDRSDERRAIAGFKCIFGSYTDICVLPQRYVDDGHLHCSDQADNCYDNMGGFICFECIDRRLIIANSQICDGVFDCFDLSDECLCENRKVGNICDNVCLGQAEGCDKGTIKCGNNLEETIRVRDVCDAKLHCSDGADERYCRKNASPRVVSCPGNIYNDTTITAFACDGRPECFDFSDECEAGCEIKQPFCDLKDRFVSSDLFVIECYNSFRLTQLDICDGAWSPCEPRIEEEETNCSARFNCISGNRSIMSIDKALICNGYRDCDDGSDELNCDRFYCVSGDSPLSVPNNFLLDDFLDCEDGSDECPPSLDNNRFSSRNEMINNIFLRVWLWLMAGMAIIGNLYVIFTTAKKFKQLKNFSVVGKANHFLIFNLALADLLMAIYLLILAFFSVYFSGKYCFEDEGWRTGNTCKALGALSVIASEASVYILSVLTGLRLYTVINPINSLELRLRYVFLATAIAWVVAAVLAVVPLSAILNNITIDGAWVTSKFFESSKIDLETIVRFSNNIGIYTPNITTLTKKRNEKVPWTTVVDYLAQNSPHHEIKGLFGFYSLNSVCVSKLFVTTKQQGWQFTIAIISVNFILFLFVLGAYIAIYRLSTTHRPAQVADDRVARMQSKIVKLVITDFLCWMPICIMAFLHFAETVELPAIAYVVTAVVLLPINSVLNPLLYSDLIEKSWKRMQFLVNKMAGLRCRCHNRKASREDNCTNQRKARSPVGLSLECNLSTLTLETLARENIT